SKKNDLVILPRHDAPKIPRSNILVTDTAPNRIVPGPEAQGSKLKGIGILIGGDAKNFELKKEDVEKVISGILKISDDEGLDIFISTSRRTSPEIGNYLKEKLAGNKRCRLLVIANENNTQGVVRDILSACDIVIVSPESVSMISEAVSSGRHVVVFTGSPLKGKYAKSVASLRSGGYLKSVPPDDIYGILRSLLTEKPPVTKIEDRNAIIKKLEAII
ncbi:MAG: mitochondrial fission ELM1 family protein, partial [Candidatus Omnitrophica bacterium]|nr:mitochondrial fission ELM1 family protein [Candidatus Omnitrophota bacterium]